MGHKYVKEDDTFSTSTNGTVPKPTAQEVTDNKYLRADGTWKNPPGGGGGASEFADLDDVSFSNLQNGQIPKYNSTTQKWENANESGGGSGHTYSTTEQVVGTWIDGKPVYERTCALSSRTIFSSQAWTATDIPTTNMKGIISIDGLDLNSQGRITLWNMLGASCDQSYVQIWQTRNTTIGLTHVILRYTKTTD